MTARTTRRPDDEIRFGILGPGKVAQLHAAALARIPGARLTAVAGRRPERAEAFAAAFGVRAEGGLDAMLDRGEVDALIICTPHPLHAQQAIVAARAGVHVVVEKPMALTMADARAMVAAAAAAGVTLSMISQRRWYPAVQRVKAAIEADRIGSPGLATVELLGWRGPEYYAMDDWRGTLEGEGGGVLANQAPHQLDLLCWFLGRPVEIAGWTHNLNHPDLDVEDSAVAIVRFESGTLATIVASNSQEPGLWGRIHVHGRNGRSVGVETEGGSMFVAGVTQPSIARNDLWTIPGEEGLPDRWLEADRASLANMDLASHYHEMQLRDIVDAIRDGRPPAVRGEDGVAVAALIEGIYAASRRGRGVNLGPEGAQTPLG